MLGKSLSNRLGHSFAPSNAEMTAFKCFSAPFFALRLKKKLNIFFFKKKSQKRTIFAELFPIL